MKRTKILVALATLGILLASCDDRPIPAEQLPEAAKAYLQENYPVSRILLVKKDYEWFRVTYDVKLDNGLEFSFNRNGLLYDVDD